jgi:hypothetical protein
MRGAIASCRRTASDPAENATGGRTVVDRAESLFAAN